MLICQFCNKESKSIKSKIAHEVHCYANPNRKKKIPSFGMKGKSSWNKGLTAATDERVQKNADSIRSTDKIIGRCADPIKEKERRKKLSISAKNQKFGGYREKAGRSKKFYVTDSFGNSVCLQSSYEFELFEIIQSMNIKWIRPKALMYNNRRYYADFYLTEFAIYLDPKNDYKAKIDREKIDSVIKQNNVKLFVILKHQINKDFIASLVQ